MEKGKTSEIVTFLRTVQEVREALRGEGPVCDDHLRAWIQVAHRVRDGWLYVQLAQLLVRHRPHDPTWVPVVVGWLLEAAQRRSLWMDHLVYQALRGWPAALLHSAIPLMCIQFHPRGFAEGLWKALQAGVLRPEAVPATWLEYLGKVSENRPAGDRAVVRQVLGSIQKSEERPVHVPTVPPAWVDDEDPRERNVPSDKASFQVEWAAV